MENNFNWFWMFVIVFYIGDSYMHLQGEDTFFWSYKTPADLELQQKRIKNRENK